MPRSPWSSSWIFSSSIVISKVAIASRSGLVRLVAFPNLTERDGFVYSACSITQDYGLNLFVDFSGYTCTNCREMEANVFPAPAVAEHLRADFVLLRLYTDDADKGPALQCYQQQTVGTVALPSYAVVTPEGTLAARHSGMASPEAFDAFLEEGLSQSPEDAAPQNVSRGTSSALVARGRSKGQGSS